MESERAWDCRERSKRGKEKKREIEWFSWEREKERSIDVVVPEPHWVQTSNHLCPGTRQSGPVKPPNDCRPNIVFMCLTVTVLFTPRMVMLLTVQLSPKLFLIFIIFVSGTSQCLPDFMESHSFSWAIYLPQDWVLFGLCCTEYFYISSEVKMRKSCSF